MTSDQLFNYASNFCKRSEAKGRGSAYPTFRQIAARFHVTYADIESIAADDLEDGKSLDVIVGFRCSGNGGIGSYKTRGEYQIAAYEA